MGFEGHSDYGSGGLGGLSIPLMGFFPGGPPGGHGTSSFNSPDGIPARLAVRGSTLPMALALSIPLMGFLSITSTPPILRLAFNSPDGIPRISSPNSAP